MMQNKYRGGRGRPRRSLDGSVGISFRIDKDAADYADRCFGSANRAALESFYLVRVLYNRHIENALGKLSGQERKRIVEAADTIFLSRRDGAFIGNIAATRLALFGALFGADGGAQHLSDLDVLVLAMWAVSQRRGGVCNRSITALGRKGGSVKSKRKAKASRENGKKGGRPHKAKV